MARNTKPDYKAVECNFDVQKDFERTKPNLGLTPQQVAEMAKRGIPVSPMNVNFIDVNGDASWNIEPQFRRDMDMATAWEMEKASQRKALQVLRQKSRPLVVSVCGLYFAFPRTMAFTASVRSTT